MKELFKKTFKQLVVLAITFAIGFSVLFTITYFGEALTGSREPALYIGVVLWLIIIGAGLKKASDIGKRY